jgi:cytochrome P450
VSFPDGLDISRWMVTRHADVVDLLSDRRLSSEIGGPLRELADPEELPPRVRVMKRTDELLGRAMVNVDPPDHTRLRRLVVPAFNARRMEALRPRVREMTDELLDAVGGRPGFDLVSTLAFWLPVRVVGELLGAPTDGEGIFRQAAHVLGGYLPDDESALASIRGMDRFEEYIGGLIADERARPADDLLSDLIQSMEDGQRLTDRELVAMAALMIFAGHETTVQLICNGVLALLRHPDQLAAVRADPDLLPGVVEETLRYDGPLNPGLTRYAVEDVPVGEVTIPRGSYVLLATSCANRDPRAFADPDTFDVTREFNEPQLGFSHGIHYCLGARMAKLEGMIAIGTVLDRFPDLRLGCEPDELRWRPGLMRAVEELPLLV